MDTQQFECEFLFKEENCKVKSVKWVLQLFLVLSSENFFTFDRNTAYHSKLSMYEDELKKRDDYIEDLKAQHKQVMQRITREM